MDKLNHSTYLKYYFGFSLSILKRFTYPLLKL